MHDLLYLDHRLVLALFHGNRRSCDTGSLGAARSHRLGIAGLNHLEDRSVHF